ncbi:hypothetical protein [Dehalobacter restrictus]|uniref:hypothetical protein n=1 Tax=Dehalobacter restrictus TaxID=55583 RepID=UPI001FA97AC3|nr:hypothetical protein [Dehalobacter restrictus]
MGKVSQEDIQEIARTAALEALRLQKDEERRQEPAERNYFRETEILLYNYPALKLKVEQDAEFLYDPEAETAPKSNRSKDIVVFSTRATGNHGLDIDQYTQSVKSSMMRTRQEVLWINRA